MRVGVGIAAASRALRLVLLTGVLGLPILAFTATPDVATRLEGPPLLAALRDGGHVRYFRHASTDPGQSDERMSGYEDCALQGNPTDTGRDGPWWTNDRAPRSCVT